MRQLSQVHPWLQHPPHLSIWKSASLSLLLLTLTGCGWLPRQQADAQPRPPQGGAAQGPPAVEVAIARSESLRPPLEYTGTTEPVGRVSVRSQTEGQLLNLNVDIGDQVTRGDLLAQIDSTLSTSEVSQAEAELAARSLEVAQAQTQVSEVRSRLEQARLELQQAQNDAERQQQLFASGAVSQQQAEVARTEARTRQQVVRSLEEQVRTQQQAVSVAQERVAAQRAIVNQAQERQNFAQLTSPLSGAVLERILEPGNLVRPGDEILRLGDFSQIKVAVQISELELSNIRTGQSVEVRLDAFPDNTFNGVVSRISPQADPVGRLVPVEVTIPNENNRLGSGLLARVRFIADDRDTLVVPQSALSKGENGGQSRGRDSSPSFTPGEQATVFILESTGEAQTVSARTVTLGQQIDDRIEIRSGLQPGERFVRRSSRPLEDGEAVRLSILSET
ncbi:MAG: efflux RND transporter periplasmic adaptor subunit [Desertifilum sp. SIO1I2]|nr:efflux RND transporter periplasmic adaptor subunit [Desertifilum sp. SIO1I2]